MNAITKVLKNYSLTRVYMFNFTPKAALLKSNRKYLPLHTSFETFSIFSQNPK